MTINQNPDIKSPVRGLATVALLKARLDQGVDQVQMFMPIILDSVAAMKTRNFSISMLQEQIMARHGLAFPHHTIGTLLNRATRTNGINKSKGAFERSIGFVVPEDISSLKQLMIDKHDALASEFVGFAEGRGKTIHSNEEALTLILTFLEENKVSILLSANELDPQQDLSDSDSRLVAEFIQHLVLEKQEYAMVVKEILEGLVVYNAAFLADITSPTRKITGLKVYFDTRFLFEALGHDGDALAYLAREIVNLLREAGVQCLFFDRTLREMEALMWHIERSLGTSEGIKAITMKYSMARLFVQQRCTQSDIRVKSSLMKSDLHSLGLQFVQIPKHVARYTLDEKKLIELIQDPSKDGSDEARVEHDVACTAAILTLRSGRRASSLADVGVVFASSTYKFITNVRRWYQDAGETGVPPVVHIRALSNLAWLRNSGGGGNLKLREMVALCQVALKPSKTTWERFIKHLENLQKSGQLTSDESVAIVVSDLTETLLENLPDDEIGEIGGLDEIVERVREAYRAEADERIVASEKQTATLVAFADTQRANAVEASRRLALALEGRVTRCARTLSNFISYALSSMVAVGGFALILSHAYHGSAIGIIIGFCVIAFLTLEIWGILAHLQHIQVRLESHFIRFFRRIWIPQITYTSDIRAPLGLLDVKLSNENEKTEVKISK